MILTRPRPRGVDLRLASTMTTILFVVGLLTCTGCASFKEQASLPWNKPPAVDGAALAVHQAQLMKQAGQSAEREGNTDEAIRLYEQARTLHPDMEHLCRPLAVLYDQSGDDARARAAYEQALQHQPSDPDLLNDFGVYHLQREDWAAAEAWFRRSLAVAPTHQRATNNLAMSLAMQNRLNESYEAFSRVVGPAAAYSNLGVLLARQSRIDEAREHFQRALAIDPTVHPAEEFLSRLDRASRELISSSSSPTVNPVSYRSQVEH